MKIFLSLFAALLSLNQVSALVAQSREVVHRDAENTACDDPSTAIPLFEGYSPSGFDHFYTINAAEMENAVHNLGYTFDGDAAYVFESRRSDAATIPLYRMFNSIAVNHFYTTSASERDNAIINLGYTDEGTAAFVYSSSICDSIPLYRLYSPRATDDFYTTSASERDIAVKRLGYNYEGIAAYDIQSRNSDSLSHFVTVCYRLTYEPAMPPDSHRLSCTMPLALAHHPNIGINAWPGRTMGECVPLLPRFSHLPTRGRSRENELTVYICEFVGV
ncbi:hypothetical protein EW146_g871 [Bondarzewia mesenterica]|uniref:DUF5648 domain-containing protein n=1 Tax=Bondarzewia mesenterica TaxID=1095465 RepID=A0A4S4M700_9AGAM|nr:hypothetical protein EW146_g871 [Bondarzewia mesenterica]